MTDALVLELDPHLAEPAVDLMATAADRHGIRRPTRDLYRAVSAPGRSHGRSSGLGPARR
ncbi:MAG: hypothetical protein V9G15_01395 [Dermatophilaceae bacterium]|nr:hypothetical protein [Actinomycetales bacterium]